MYGLQRQEDSTAARAVLVSGLTTIASFGALSFSSHLGLASLGQLLTLGMALILACNLLFLPAVLVLGRFTARKHGPSKG